MRNSSIYSVVGFFCLFIMVLPVIIVILLSFNGDNYINLNFSNFSFKWFENFFTDSQWYTSFITSFVIATLSSIISITLGFLTLYITNTNRILKLIILITFILPLIIPPIILGISFLFFFSSIGLVDTFIGLVLAHALLSFPFSYIIINTGFSNMNPALVTIAKSNGASNTFTILQVIIPSIRKNILISFFFSFLVSFDEPVIALFLSNSKVRTLPRQIFDGLRYDLDPTISAVSSILIIISIFIILFVTKRNKSIT